MTKAQAKENKRFQAMTEHDARDLRGLVRAGHGVLELIRGENSSRGRLGRLIEEIQNDLSGMEDKTILLEKLVKKAVTA